jgi:hypothetical protein
VHLYYAKVAQHDVKAAVEMEGEWGKAKGQVLLEMEDLLEHVLREGAESGDIVGRFEKLSGSTRGWLDLLVPRRWNALTVQELQRDA